MIVSGGVIMFMRMLMFMHVGMPIIGDMYMKMAFCNRVMDGIAFTLTGASAVITHVIAV